MTVNNNYTSIRQIQETYLKNNGTASRAKKGESRTFEDILSQKTGLDSEIQSLKFSKHADERLADRNISLTEDQLGRLAEGARKADEKGIRESLVIMDDLSFIINIRNKTVITAMDHADNKEQIYTNIDGAVII